MTGHRSQFNRYAHAVLAALALPIGALAAEPCHEVPAGRIAVIGGAFAVGQTAAIVARHDDWWPGPTQSFHFAWGGSPSDGQDGLLHASIAYQASQAGALAFDWACLPYTTAGWLGAALAVAVGLPKEIGDGFHDGFSGTDMLATAAGALLPALHRSVPTTRVAALKVFYWPSEEYRNRTGRLPQLENDYAGQRFFLSLNPARPPGASSSWPAWLGLVVGHGVPSWVTLPPKNDWYVALDVEFRGLPIRARWWRKVAAVLDQGHVPSPGVRIRSGNVDVGMF